MHVVLLHVNRACRENRCIKNTPTHTYTHTQTHIYTHIHTNTHTYSHTYIHTHKHIHTYRQIYTHTHTHTRTQAVLWRRCIYFHNQFTACFYSLQYKVTKLRVSQFTFPISVSRFLTHTLHSAHKRNGFNSRPASISRLYLLHHVYSLDFILILPASTSLLP